MPHSRFSEKFKRHVTEIGVALYDLQGSVVAHSHDIAVVVDLLAMSGNKNYQTSAHLSAEFIRHVTETGFTLHDEQGSSVAHTHDVSVAAEFLTMFGNKDHQASDSIHHLHL